MNKIRIAVALLFFWIGSNAYALNGDSVMSPNGTIEAEPNVSQNMGNISAPQYSSVAETEYRYGNCPQGFKFQGENLYPAEVRDITTYYLNGALVGKSASAWLDLDLDCTKTEQRSIACAIGFTGTQSQSRLVTTKGGNVLDYGAWNTYANNCVIKVVELEYKYCGVPGILGSLQVVIRVMNIKTKEFIPGYINGGEGLNWEFANIGNLGKSIRLKDGNPDSPMNLINETTGLASIKGNILPLCS